jgi:enamine deaminase RidA (YjgF/YER057c/UK114 family)
MSISERLNELGVVLPQVAAPLASYVPAVQSGNLVFTSGQLPTVAGELTSVGQVGGPVSEEAANTAARVCCLNALAAVQSVISDLDRVVRVVRVVGYVSSADGFVNQPKVINGASDFLLELFGEKGQHSRTAIGVSALPRNASVELELVVEVGD